MARLTSFLKNLNTPEERLAGAQGLMAFVYGEFDPLKGHTKDTWQPGPYRENISRYLWTDAFGVVNYISLAKSASGVPSMYWKISIDMHRPMVPSEGNLDPFDGLVTVRLVKNTAAMFQSAGAEVLVREEQDFMAMVEAKYRRYHSSDPLDLGEALWLSHWALNSSSSSSGGGGGSGGGSDGQEGSNQEEDEPWARFVATQSIQNLEQLWKDGYFSEPAGYRLAFREFGTTLGVQVNVVAKNSQWKKERIDALHTFWASRVIERDMDITPVMMASSLVPGVWDKNFKF